MRAIIAVAMLLTACSSQNATDDDPLRMLGPAAEGDIHHRSNVGLCIENIMGRDHRIARSSALTYCDCATIGQKRVIAEVPAHLLLNKPPAEWTEAEFRALQAFAGPRMAEVEKQCAAKGGIDIARLRAL